MVWALGGRRRGDNGDSLGRWMEAWGVSCSVVGSLCGGALPCCEEEGRWDRGSKQDGQEDRNELEVVTSMWLVGCKSL